MLESTLLKINYVHIKNKNPLFKPKYERPFYMKCMHVNLNLNVKAQEEFENFWSISNISIFHNVPSRIVCDILYDNKLKKVIEDNEL